MTTAKEKYRTKGGDRNSHEIGYVVRDASDALDAMAAVAAEAPATFDSMPLVNIQYEEIRGPEIWELTATYSRRSYEAPDEGAIEYSFETSLGTKQVFLSDSTVQKYTSAGAGTGEDFYGAIAVDSSDGVAQGVDILVPESAFSYRWYAPVATVTAAYQRNVQGMVGKVNSVSFQGYAAGSLLFAGVSGGQRSEGDWEIDYRFQYRPNVSGLTIADISGIDVDGWDILWPYYETEKQVDKYIRKPVQVNVERVFKRADFATILLFGGP